MVFETVVGILARLLEIDEDYITPEMKLAKEEGMEPINLAKLIIRCEKRFEIVIQDEDVYKFICVNDLVDYISNLLNENEEVTPVNSDEEREAWYYR